MFNSFATTNKGLENLLADELEKFGAINTIIATAGVSFRANFKTIMALNLHSSLASRIMFEVANGYYSSEEDIYEIAKNVNWHDYFTVNNSIKIKTSTIGSSVRSLDFISLKVKDAICDKFVDKENLRPSVNKFDPDIRIYTFLTMDTVTIYIDSSGEALFKRGYRQDKLEASLKENLAAGIIKLTPWQDDIPLYDPMCGSGTIVIEALHKALNIAPGLKREFAFKKLKLYNKQLWQDILNEARNNINYNKKLNIYASDINPQAVAIAKINCGDLVKYINFKTIDFRLTTAPEKNGIIISNIPYGIRLQQDDEFYPQMAKTLKQQYANWNCYLLSANLTIAKLMRLKPSCKKPITNGALDCRLYEFKMVSGSNRN